MADVRRHRAGSPRTWLNRIVLALLWIAVTAGVAFLVARAARQRSTVTLTARTIAPIVSGEGTPPQGLKSYRYAMGYAQGSMGIKRHDLVDL